MLFDILNKIFFLALHIINFNSFPKTLSSKKEKEYFERVKKGDKDAKDELINHNLRLVAHIIKKFNLPHSNNEDLISVGTIGLIKAVNTFKMEKGIRFSSYASRCIENEILMNLRGVKKTSLDVSMNETIESSKPGSSITLMDTISDKSSYFEKIFNKISMEKLSIYMSKKLTNREQSVIKLRYGLNNKEPMTQQEVAEELGISRSYVSRIEKKALGILKEEIKD